VSRVKSNLCTETNNQKLEMTKPKRPLPSLYSNSPNLFHRNNAHCLIITPEEHILETEQPNAQVIISQINSALDKKNAPPAERIKAIQYSATGNIVAITAKDVRAEDMMKHQDAFSEALHQNCSLQPDVKWLKLIVHMVPCRDLHSNMLTILQVMGNLIFLNRPMQLAAEPRWLNCDSLEGKLHSSLVLSFVDAEEYLKWKNSTIIFAGGLCKTGTFED
jgi:hypothetical protein